MKKFTFRNQQTFGTATLVVALAWAWTSQAGLRIPYAPDVSTMHLWHLDEAAGVLANDAIADSGITLTNIGWPVGGPYTNTSLGGSSFTGMGTCVSAINKGHVLYGGAFPDVYQFCNLSSGAFTFEALVKFNIDPRGTIDAEIVCGDNGSGLANRGWQWRIFNGDMEWNLLAGSGSDNDFKVKLPATGPNAAITGAWYHAAVTFTGESPTNSDPANVLTFYWTLLDENRVAADKLGQFTMTRPLNGTPAGAAAPGLGVAGSARNTTGNPGNNEGLIGSIDEVRISAVARGSNEMAFTAGGAQNPPLVTTQPPAAILVGYGQTLVIPALVSGSLPLHYQWQRNGADVPGQTETTLLLPNATFEAAGNYQLVVTNAYGRETSQATQVTVGAVPTGLFNTGLDTNGLVSAGNIPDPHWSLIRSADPSFLGPQLPIFEYAFPIQFADPAGAFSPTNGKSMWIGAGGNTAGVTYNSPAGQYIHRARFLIDSADPATVTMGGTLWANGSISDILVNGKSTGMALAPGGTLYAVTYSLTSGFVAGWNTVDFIENLTGSVISGLRVEISGIGLALPPSLPAIIEQPVSETVRDGNVPPNSSKAIFSVAALGRPPLSYQWRVGGMAIPGATHRTLVLENPTGATRSYDVVVSNDSGSVTSQAATLTIVPNNQPPVPKAFSVVAFEGQTFTLPLSDLVQLSTDPDHDAISFVGADTSSTNGAAAGLANVELVGASLVYTPVAGYVGADLFTYTISDSVATPVGTVKLLQLQAPQPASQAVAPGGAVNLSVGIVSAPPGYSFQWQLNGTAVPGATSGQFNVSNAQVGNSGSYQLVVTDPLGQTWPSPVAGLTVGVPNTGTGLTGDYYAVGNGTTNFTGLPTLTRLDPSVDFDFASDAPDPSLPVDYFQIRWHGQVQPLFSDVYTFSTRTDDGARLWVNNQLVVNRWQNQSATTASGTIELAAGQKYDLVFEYYENTSSASARLSWSSTHQPSQIIPTTQLYPGSGLLRPKLAASVTGTNIVVNWAGTFLLQSASDLNGPWTDVANSTIGPRTIPIGGSQKAFYRLVNPISP